MLLQRWVNKVDKYTSNTLPSELLEAFRAAGFIDYTYPGQEGVFLRKELVCGEMPLMKAGMIDGEYVVEDTACIVELIPDGRLQAYIPDVDYVEHQEYPVNKDGFLSLAEDAGVNLSTLNLVLNTKGEIH